MRSRALRCDTTWLIAARDPCCKKVVASAQLISNIALSASSEELKHTKPKPCDLAPSLTTYNKNQCVKDPLHASLNDLKSCRICHWICLEKYRSIFFLRAVKMIFFGKTKSLSFNIYNLILKLMCHGTFVFCSCYGRSGKYSSRWNT